MQASRGVSSADKLPQGGDVGSGFLLDFVPVALAGVINVAVIGLDTVSDWLAYRTFRAIIYDDDDHNGVAGIQRDNQPIASQRPLAVAFFVFCVVASVINAVELVRCCATLARRHARFLNQRDGLPVKASSLVRYCGEALTLLQVLAEDLPLSAILLAFQARIGCRLIVPFDATIIGVSLLTAGVNVLWKAVQVIWRAGCLGYRDEYYRSRYASILRAVTLAVLAAAATVIVLALLLFASERHTWPASVIRSALFDKIGVDRWVARDRIVLEHRDPRGDVFNYTDLVDLRSVLHAPDRDVIVQLPCFESFVSESSQNCSMSFSFRFFAASQQIAYNYGYSVQDNDTCVTRTFCDSCPIVNGTQTQTWSHSATPRNESFGVALSPQMSDDWMKCSYMFVYNSSILPLHLCNS